MDGRKLDPRLRAQSNQKIKQYAGIQPAAQAQCHMTAGRDVLLQESGEMLG
jgi:hypothetical protein